MPSERIQRVLDAGLDKISFSFDGENPTDYEQIRVGAKFEHTLNNILRFLQIKKLRGGKFPLTTIQVIKYYHTPNSDKITSEFKQHFANLPVDEFLLLHPFVWPDQKAQDFNRPSGSKYYPCMIPWTSLSLGWDGRVFWCCGDLNGKGFLGNIRQTTLKEIWNGELIHTIRHGLVKRELKNLQLCQNCEALYHRYNPIFADFRDYWRQIKRTL
jgi:radical SAM protein with 4Fe4S-binding SPASM domain